MSQPNSGARTSIASDHKDAMPRSTRRPHHKRRGSSHTRRSLSADSDEDYRRSRKNKGSLPAVDERDDPPHAVRNTPRSTANKLTETVAQNAAADGGQDNTLSLRLDLNLDVYVKLTAKIHGDITLTLL
jgi:hypothetical protein